MTIVNVDGMALFGPGSEWFWAMAQFAILAVTGIAIYRQLRAQRWANQATIVGKYSDYFDSEQMTRYKLAALSEVRAGADGLTPAMRRVGDFFENTAVAQRDGHMSSRYAWEQFSAVAQTYWALFAPILPAAREHEPDHWTAWERWIVDLARRDVKAGARADVRPAHLAWWIDDTIAYYRERLRIEIETRTGAEPAPAASAPEVDGGAVPVTVATEAAPA